MTTFTAVNDASLARRIDGVTRRLVYVAPGMGKATAEALVRAIARESQHVTIILDADEDAHRIGFGEPEALAFLHEAAAKVEFPLRRQTGLRIGLAVLDDELLIWAPTARSVEPEREQQQPNAIVLSGPVVQKVEAAVGSDTSSVLPKDAEIGRDPLRLEEIEATIEKLAANPPAPFDLARKTRVFSTRFQFVEFEIRGAEWTERRIKLSSLLLNADLPESVQDILDTQVRPFQAAADRAFEVPHIVKGRRAYEENGDRMLVPASQADIVKTWGDIRDRYLYHLKGFGWLIQRDKLQAFQSEVDAYEETLRAWVNAFRAHTATEEGQLVHSIADSIIARIQHAARPYAFRRDNIESEVQCGLKRLRVIEPRVRIVLKNVSWESTRDEEFTEALQRALPKDLLQGWFEEYTAVRQRPNGAA